MSSITRVILPGLGEVCPECFTRGFVGDFPITGLETYTFSLTQPESELNWDIPSARELLAERPRQPTRLDPAALAGWLRSRVTITSEHLNHIPADKRDEPGIVVVVSTAIGPEAPLYELPILIDGSHRAALALRDGRDFFAYLLTEDEQRSICTYRVGGQLTEIPLVPGPGVTDRQAGLR